MSSRASVPSRAVLHILVLSFLGGCALSDLRTAALQESGVLPELEEKGRAILSASQDAHGGLESWKDLGTIEYIVRDEWPRWLTRAVAMPWDFSGQALKLSALLGEDAIRLRFEEGDREGTVWGIQNWATYHVPAGGELVVEPDEDIWFWLPTVEYFVELPFRIAEATTVAYMGEEKVGDQDYDLVFATWGDAEPQDKTDQYVVWVNQRTRLVEYVEFTVRDFMDRTRSTIAYENYRQVQGIQVPHLLVVGGTPHEPDVLHRMTLSEARFDTGEPRSLFYPRPDISRAKHSSQ